MTHESRKQALEKLYAVVSDAKLQTESDMDKLIQEGLTKKLSATLLDIMELTLTLIRDKST